MDEAAKLQAVYRYPVKGLSAEPLQDAELAVGGTIAGDRACLEEALVALRRSAN